MLLPVKHDMIPDGEDAQNKSWNRAREKQEATTTYSCMFGTVEKHDFYHDTLGQNEKELTESQHAFAYTSFERSEKG